MTTTTPSATEQHVLSASNVTVRFGGLVALRDVSISVRPHSMTGLVGPNGAGKTTFFGVLSGLQKSSSGTVELNGSDVTTMSPQARARVGLARTFQQPELFHGLTVREHLRLGYRARHQRSRILGDIMSLGSLRRSVPAENERVDALLDVLMLGDLADESVSTLPLGTSRLVEVGRALATEPAIMLLDEPLSGLDEYEAERLADVLRRSVELDGTAILMVEHDVPMVLRLCSEIFVLDFGQLIASGPPEAVRADPVVQAAYLGGAPVATTHDNQVEGVSS